MQLLGELAIGLGDVLGLRGPRHAESGVEIVCHLGTFEMLEGGKASSRIADLDCSAIQALSLPQAGMRGRRGFPAPGRAGRQVLEPAVDALAFEIRIGLRQGPDQPIALEAERRVGKHAGHRGRDHMRGAERGRPECARASPCPCRRARSELWLSSSLIGALVAVIDGEREEGAAGMIDADEIAMRDEIEALHAAIVGMGMPADIGEEAGRVPQAASAPAFRSGPAARNRVSVQSQSS